ncbi:MAG: DMT family transporter [Lachnospiraceae bacterium]|jgi:DME family drug/metabolite transporter
MNTSDSNRKFRLSGNWMVFMAAVFWSLNAPLVKFIQLDPIFLCGFRALIAGIALCPFIRFKKLNFSPWMLVYFVSHFALGMTLIFALKNTSAAIAVGMQYTAMIWIFLVNAIITRKFSMKRFFPVLLTFSGVICFMLSGFGGGNMIGNIVAFTEGIAFAMMTASSQKAGGDNPMGLTALANLCTGFFIFLFLPPQFSDILQLGGQEWLIMLILGVVQVGLGYGFYNIGVQRTTAQKASILAIWEMILGPLWVALFLKEYPSALEMAGFVIIIVGLVTDALMKKSPEETKAVCADK